MQVYTHPCFSIFYAGVTLYKKWDFPGFLQQIWPNPQETADLVTFTEDILNEKPFVKCYLSETELGGKLNGSLF